MSRTFAIVLSAAALLHAQRAVAQTTTNHIVYDSFGRTTGLGSSWQVVYGGFTTDGTYAISATPPINGDWAAVVPSLGSNDYSVSATIIIPSGSIDSGLFARSTSRSGSAVRGKSSSTTPRRSR